MLPDRGGNSAQALRFGRTQRRVTVNNFGRACSSNIIFDVDHRVLGLQLIWWSGYAGPPDRPVRGEAPAISEGDTVTVI